MPLFAMKRTTSPRNLIMLETHSWLHTSSRCCQMQILLFHNRPVPTLNPNSLKRKTVIKTSLPLPETIADDIQGVLNAIERNIGIHKFLFHGPAGTGKTESVKQISSIMQRELYVVNFNSVIDSRLGQTAKNITKLFAEINSFTHPRSDGGAL